MWFRQARFIDFHHHWSWRKCIVVLTVLLIINTAFHWSLVHDVHSQSGQPDHRKTIATSKGDEGSLFHDRVISINKWFDDNGEGADEKRGLDFEVVNDEDSKQKGVRGEPLITYITRKPFNRKPLGEAPTKRGDSATESPIPEGSKNSEPKYFENASLSPLSIVQNNSEMFIKVTERKKQINKLRGKLQTRKREIMRNKSSETREIVLPFLQNPQSKIRPASRLKTKPQYEYIAKVINTLHTSLSFNLFDIYSQEKIRYYSLPIWLNSADINAMNLLAGSWIFRRRPDQHLTSSASGPHLILMSNSEMEGIIDKLDANGVEQGGTFPDPDTGCDRAQTSGCRTAWCSFDLSVVVAFHLDRVIGLNITAPTVARELPVGTRPPTAPLHAGGPIEPHSSKSVLGGDLPVRTVALSVTSLHGAHAERRAEPSVTRARDRGDSTKLTQASATNAEFSDELSEKLIIFCFLLKISNCSMNIWNDYLTSLRGLDESAVTETSPLPCRDVTGHSPVTIFRSPSALFDEGTHLLHRSMRLSKANRDLLVAGRIRQCLLQSLFVDRVFWAEAGGRRVIEDLLNVLDVRIKELAEWTSKFSRAADGKR